MLLDSIASPVFCDPYVRKDFLTLATLLLTSNPVDTVLGGTRDLAGWLVDYEINVKKNPTIGPDSI